MVDDRWQENQAQACSNLLEQRIYSSRLLGQDHDLVMHGGGNTSLKDIAINLFGENEEILRIKGSGWDLATIQAAGLPALRLKPLLRLRSLAELTDVQMVNELRSQLLDARAPDPSVETLLHAFLPHRFIDHTHADSVLTLTNQPDGERIIRELYGSRVGVVPYIMPGFQLAKQCATIYEQNPQVIGLILLKHGVFSFGDSARESYQRMLELVGSAESCIRKRRKAAFATVTRPPRATSEAPACPQENTAWWLHALRAEFARRQWICCATLDASDDALAFTRHPDLLRITHQGPVTPDHVIRTKSAPLLMPAMGMTKPADAKEESQRLAMISEAIDGYAARYRSYFERLRNRSSIALTMLDPWPRIIVLPGIGVVSMNATVRDASISRDIYQHTMRVIMDAESSSRYSALPEDALFDMEYWVLEQAKLSLAPKRMPLTGKTAVVSGGANGIGLAIAKELLSAGANVAIWDLNESVFAKRQLELSPLCRGGNAVRLDGVDVTKRARIHQAVLETIIAFGGIDIVVVNAGIFGPSANIEDISDGHWARALEVNLNGAFHLISEHMPWLKRQPGGGDIVLIASKNVPAPGKQAAAYSVSKAAQTQLARVCALEGGAHGVRVNTLHPHLVLDTELWTSEVVASRAAAYGMSVEQYRTNNLLKTEITSRDVARSALALVMGYFDKTTGAQICVDGGSDRTL